MTLEIDYASKRVVLTGAASGIGRAAAEALVEAGAELYAMDIKPSDLGTYIPINLLDPASIRDAFARFDGPIDALFNCAGLGAGQSDLSILLCNFAGTRAVIDEAVPLMHPGAAIVSVSSSGGVRWRHNVDQLRPLLATPGFDEAQAWSAAHVEGMQNAYSFSKEALSCYTVLKARQLAPLGIRINTVSPLGIETPMWHAFVDTLSEEERARMLPFVAGLEGRLGSPAELANALLFLNSDLAAHIDGTDLLVDGGGLSATEPEVSAVELPPMRQP